MSDHQHDNLELPDNQKIFDKVLLKKLLVYARPYKWYLSLILVFVVLTVACELALPLISRHIIDDFINPKYKIVQFTDHGEALDFKKSYQSLVLDLDDNNFLLPSGNENKILIADLKMLKKERKIGDDIYYYLSYEKLSGKEIERLEQFKNEARFYPHGLAVSYNALKKLSSDQLKIIRYEDLNSVKFFGLLFFLIMLINFFLSYFQVYAITVMGQKIMFDIRVRLFAHLEKMPVSFFDKNPLGVLVTRVTNDISNLEEFFSAVLINLFKDIFIIVSILAVLLTISVKLALISFIILPVITVVTILFKKRMRAAYRWVRAAIAKINAMLAENLNGISIIQIFNRENHNYQKFKAQNHDYYLASFKQMVLNAIFNPLMSFIRYFAIALILYNGSHSIMASTISVGTLVAFLAYIEKFFEPIQDISEKVNLMQSALASSERIFGLLELDQEEGYAVKNINIPAKITGSIEFRNVWFAYNEENWVLKNFSLKIGAGESIALVGPTGAGKTSVINILNRFYEIQKGEILIDGINIKELPLGILRKYIGSVQQDVFLFSGTIRDNIALNNPEIDSDRLIEVTRLTNAYDFISKLPDQFESELKEGGASVSTGQKQLISFSRMLAYNPQILVLDEATSSIDTETEVLIQDALNKLMQNRTSIIVAHRLSTIQHCDKIAVIHRGEIREIGNHQELLEKKGIYHNLYLLQYKEQLTAKAG